MLSGTEIIILQFWQRNPWSHRSQEETTFLDCNSNLIPIKTVGWNF